MPRDIENGSEVKWNASRQSVFFSTWHAFEIQATFASAAKYELRTNLEN
jgi:hypothetical protein